MQQTGSCQGTDIRAVASRGKRPQSVGTQPGVESPNRENAEPWTLRHQSNLSRSPVNKARLPEITLVKMENSTPSRRVRVQRENMKAILEANPPIDKPIALTVTHAGTVGVKAGNGYRWIIATANFRRARIRASGPTFRIATIY